MPHYDLGTVDKSNNKVYDKIEFFTTPEQLKSDLDTFYKHFRENSLDQFLTDITRNGNTEGTQRNTGSRKKTQQDTEDTGSSLDIGQINQEKDG